MPPQPDKPLRGKLIDFPGYRKKFAYACGKTLCDTNANRERMWVDGYADPFPILPVVFPAKFVDMVWDDLADPPRWRRLFAIASECNFQPWDARHEVTFVRSDLYPPFGITDVVGFQFILGGFPLTVQCVSAGSGATGDGCPIAYLYWDGDRTWEGEYQTTGGSNLTIALELLATQDPDRPLVDGWDARLGWQVTFSGCESPARVVTGHVSCFYPLAGGGQYGGPLDAACCATATDSPDLGFRFFGFTERRIQARFVDLERGGSGDGRQRVFLTNECCEPRSGCDFGECCGCEVSPFQWELVVAGITNGAGPPFPGTNCPCHNGTYVLTMSATNTLTGVCSWTNAVADGPCYPTVNHATWTLTCNPGTGLVTLGSQLTPEGGGSVNYQMSLTDWDCMGPNTLTRVFSVPICSNYPATLTVTPV